MVSENILKTAKALVEDTKTLVAGAASNQEQLAKAARSAVMTITELAECVKHGAASIGSEQPEAQVRAGEGREGGRGWRERGRGVGEGVGAESNSVVVARPVQIRRQIKILKYSLM